MKMSVTLLCGVLSVAALTIGVFIGTWLSIVSDPGGTHGVAQGIVRQEAGKMCVFVGFPVCDVHIKATETKGNTTYVWGYVTVGPHMDLAQDILFSATVIDGVLVAID